MKRLTSGELAKRGGVNVETIRYYERRELLPRPPRSAGGYRVFPDDALQRLHFIKRAQGLGFSLKEIKELLALHVDPETTCDEVRRHATSKIDQIDQKVRSLIAMKESLQRLVEACRSRGDTGECPILDCLDCCDGDASC